MNKIAFTRHEILSIEDFAKNMDDILNNLLSCNTDKYAILHNDRADVVVIPSKDYEKLLDAQDFYDEQIREGRINGHCKQ